MRKRYRLHLQGREHLDRWLVSYADYMTLIFALFVVLYSVAIVNKEQYRAVIEGMTQAFNQVPRSDGLLEGQGNSLLNNPVSAASSLLESQASPSPSLAPITGTPIQQDGTALATIDLQLQEAMGALVEAGVVKLAKDDNWLTVELTDVVPFLVEDEFKKLGGLYEKGADWQSFVITDGLLVTGQNPGSSSDVAKALLKLTA